MNYTSRSAIDLYQKCHRARYIQYFWPDETGKQVGIVPVTNSVPLTTGTCVHAGVAFLLSRHILKADILNDPSEVDAAVVVATKMYHDLVADAGFHGKDVGDTEPRQKLTFNEQLALTEALVRVWHIVEAPQLLERYHILSSEKELTPIEITPGVFLQVRADAILRDKEDKSIYAYSLKTLKQWGDRESKSYPDDIQTITEPYGIEQHYASKGIRVMGVRFCILIKGRRERLVWSDETSPYVQASPLVRGYKYIGEDRVKYAHSFWFPNSNNPSGKGRLGNGWERFNVWEDPSVGLDRWLLTLRTNRIQPECGDILRAQVITPPEVFRDQGTINSVLVQISNQEHRVFTDAKKVATAIDQQDRDKLLDIYFPEFRHACWYPTECEYALICKDGLVKSDPLHSGLYKIREAHHQAEKDYLEL